MKELNHLFRFSCLLILVTLLIDGSESDLNVKISTDITTNYNTCKYPVEDLNPLDSYGYIDDNYRYNLCKKQYPEFDIDKFISVIYKPCLGPQHQITVSKNPCAVVCPTYSYFYEENDGEGGQGGEGGDQLRQSESGICQNFLSKYRNVTRVILLRDTEQRCGPDHHCNALGCCVKRQPNTEGTTHEETETTTPSTTTRPTSSPSTPTTPSTPPTTPTTASPTTPSTPPTTASPTTPSTPPTTASPTTPSTPPTTVSPTTPSTPPTTVSPTTPSTPPTPTTVSPTSCSTDVSSSTPSTTPSPTTHTSTTVMPQIYCQSVGTFKYPNDASNRKYYKCSLKAELKVCPFGQIFDEKLSECTHITTKAPTTEPTTVTHTVSTVTTSPAIDWSKYFKCTKEGYFRNPYDCTRYYRCYKNEGDNRTIWFADRICGPNLLFDEDPGPTESGEKQDPTCVRKGQYISRHGVCKEIALPHIHSY